MIRERINDAYIRKIPEENGNGEPISWTFVEEEPKEIKVVEKKVEGDRATIILDVKTVSSRDRAHGDAAAVPRRTNSHQWELRTGWVLRKWEIVNTENISMKYRDLRKHRRKNPDR